MNDPVTLGIVHLLDKERFYAEVLMSMKRVNNPSLPAVAGVCIKTNIELHTNLELFKALSIPEAAAVLKHECEHILRDHIARFKDLIPDLDKTTDSTDAIIKHMKFKTLNVAADLAINDGIKDLPSFGCFTKNFDLPPGETMEWYANALRDNKKMREMTNFDGHELWSESEGSKEMLREKIRQAINDAAKRTRAVGQMTADNELLVSELNKSLINWKQQLKRFAAKTIESITDTTRKKRNRRYGVLYPGQVRVEQLNLAVAIDTSGSVPDWAIVQFMTEINNIAKYANVVVVEADSEVKNSYVFDPKKKYRVSGRGGTAYQPAIDYFNEYGDIDGLIYFGDMDTADNEAMIKPKYPVLWAIVGNQDPPVPWGSKIYIKE